MTFQNIILRGNGRNILHYLHLNHRNHPGNFKILVIKDLRSHFTMQVIIINAEWISWINIWSTKCSFDQNRIFGLLQTHHWVLILVFGHGIYSRWTWCSSIRGLIFFFFTSWTFDHYLQLPDPNLLIYKTVGWIFLRNEWNCGHARHNKYFFLNYKMCYKHFFC